ncbi:hypothetical protein V1281_005485 [Nitrobacteraceae bacterium AZCC 2161]
MTVPPVVPAKVPAKLRRSQAGGAPRAPRYLTGSPSGWRFQMRLSQNLLSADFRLAGLSRIIRVQVGPRSRSEAKVLAGQLASLCQTVFAAAADRNATNMTMQLSDPDEMNLARQVIDACENGIKQALGNPRRAVELAKGIGSALAQLQLVQSEAAKGAAGVPVITANADALTRAALTDVLAVASRPDTALAAVNNVAPAPAVVQSSQPSPRRRNRCRRAVHHCRPSAKFRRTTSTCAARGTARSV